MDGLPPARSNAARAARRTASGTGTDPIASASSATSSSSPRQCRDVMLTTSAAVRVGMRPEQRHQRRRRAQLAQHSQPGGPYGADWYTHPPGNLRVTATADPPPAAAGGLDPGPRGPRAPPRGPRPAPRGAVLPPHRHCRSRPEIARLRVVGHEASARPQQPHALVAGRGDQPPGQRPRLAQIAQVLHQPQPHDLAQVLRVGTEDAEAGRGRPSLVARTAPRSAPRHPRPRPPRRQRDCRPSVGPRPTAPPRSPRQRMASHQELCDAGTLPGNTFERSALSRSAVVASPMAR